LPVGSKLAVGASAAGGIGAPPPLSSFSSYLRIRERERKRERETEVKCLQITEENNQTKQKADKERARRRNESAGKVAPGSKDYSAQK
jgi:hypothetical protein